MSERLLSERMRDLAGAFPQLGKWADQCASLEAENARLRKVYEAADIFEQWSSQADKLQEGNSSYNAAVIATISARNALFAAVREARDGG